MDFDGVNDWINLASQGSINCLNGTSGGAMSAWVTPDTLSSNPLVDLSINAGGPVPTSRLTMDRSAVTVGALESFTRAPDAIGPVICTAPAALTTGVQANLLVSSDVPADLEALYQSGTQVSLCNLALTNAAFDATNSTSGSIGADADGGLPSDAKIEDVRIYSRNVSANEAETINACRGHDGIWFGLCRRYPLVYQPPGTAAVAGNTIVDVALNKVNAAPADAPVYEETRLSYRRRYP